MKKRLISVLLTVLLLLGLLPVSAFAATTVASGSCGGEGDGTNLTWTLDSDGLLTIRGTGAMADYVYNMQTFSASAPWGGYSDSILAINIREGVTSIGNSAFTFCEKVESISIPEGVTSIGHHAIAWCFSLPDITLPDSLKSLGSGAFYWDRSLAEITIPASVESIGSNAFARCLALSGIKVAEGNQYFVSVDGVLFSSDMRWLLQFPCTRTGTYAIPEGVVSVDLEAFQYSSLEQVTLPASLFNVSSPFLFSSLQNITVDENSQYYSSVDGVLFSKDQTSLVAYPTGRNAESYAIPEGVTSIESFAFDGCLLKRIEIPASVTSIGNGAFLLCNALQSVSYAGDDTQWSEIEIAPRNEILVNARSAGQLDLSSKFAYDETFAVSEVSLNGAKAPNGNRDSETNSGDLIADALKWYIMQFPSDLKVDADHVLAITNGGGIRAALPAGEITMNDVHEVLFFGNTVAVVYVSGAELLEALEASTYCTPEAVGGFPQVSGINFTVDTTKAYDANAETYPNSIYHGPASINRVTINSINGKSFDPAATYAVVTNNFCAAGGDTYSVFADNECFGTGMPMDMAVSSYIYYGLNAVIGQEYAEPQGRIFVKGINPFVDVAEDAYYKDAVVWARDNNIVSGKSATTFDPDGTVTREEAMTFIYRYAQSVGQGFSGAWMVMLDFKDTDSIHDWAYEAVAWGKMNGVITSYEDGNFRPTDKITREELITLLYRFAEVAGLDISVDPEINYLGFGDLPEVSHYALPALVWAQDKGVLECDGQGNLMPKSCASRAELVTWMYRVFVDPQGDIPVEPVIASGSCGGEGDGTNLTWVLDAAGTLTIRGIGAMANYESADTPWYAFSDGITDIRIGNGVTWIGVRAFCECNNLQNLVLPEGLKGIGGEAFAFCSALDSVTLPESLESIYAGAFMFCSPTLDITVPKNVSIIMSDPFAGCRSISVDPDNANFCAVDGVLYSKDMTRLLNYPGGSTSESFAVPNGVTEIAYYSFVGANNLKELIIPASVQSVGEYAFPSSSALTDVYYKGTRQQWEAVTIQPDGNDALQNATIHYLGDAGTSEFRLEAITVSSMTGEKLQKLERTNLLVSVAVNRIVGDTGAAIMLAEYDADGRYQGLMWLTIDEMAAGTRIKITLPVDNRSGRISDLKAFVVDSISNPVPIGNAVSFLGP